MDEFDFEEFGILDHGEPQNVREPRTFPLWKFLVALVSIFVIMVMASLVICVSNSECRAAVPTAHTLLSSPMTAPYMILGLSSGLYVFFITCLALYVKTDNKLVVGLGALVYASIGGILVVFPFTGWNRNYAIFGFIAAFMAWMCAVANAFRHTYADKLRRLHFVAIVFYAASSLVYVVLKFVPSTSIGVMVVQITGALSIVGFMAVCLAYVWDVKITVSPK